MKRKKKPAASKIDLKPKRGPGRPRLPEAEVRRRAAKKLKAAAKKAKHRAAMHRLLTAQGQDIGKIPACKNSERRDKAIASFKVFCDTYFSEVFYLPWSRDLLKVCAKVEQVVIRHDKIVILMPRGSGKSALCKSAVLWAVLSGRHQYVILIGATADNATKDLQWFKDELTENDKLLEDWPRVCYPIRKLDHEPRKCMGQRFEGRKTKIRWGKDRIVLPKIPDSVAAQAVIETASLEGNIRGRWIRIEGRIVRPTLAIPDDPQTAESSRSQGPDGQTTHRLETINQDVQGLAGPTARTAILVPATIIQRGDLADQLLKDRKFHGERMKRLYAFPKNAALWERYKELRDGAMNDIPDAATEATAFYRARMCKKGRKLDEPADSCSGCKHADACMDCGAVVDWAARTDDPQNLSAVQAAMHSMYDYGPAGFASEFQNEPLLSAEAARLPTAEEICDQANGYNRGQVPDKAIHLTAFIDVGDDYLAYLVAAWEKNFTGAVIDYGTWPDQGRSFTKATATNLLGGLYPKAGVEGSIVLGLKDLAGNLLSRSYAQASGPPLQINLCFIDTGYKPESVYAAMRLLNRGPVLRPSRGRGIPAGRAQFDDYHPDRCREMGLHWWIPKESPQAVIQIDTNFWKTFVHTRLATTVGDPGALTLYGRSWEHVLLAAHILAEYYTTPSTEKGVKIQEWHQHVGKDNEFFDCYDSETEVLTLDGFKYFKNITATDQLATVDLKTDFIEYQKPTALVKRWHDGEMIQFGGKKYSRINLCVTPTHRMVIYAGQSSRGPVVQQARDLGIWDKLKVAARWKGKRRDTFIIPECGERGLKRWPAVRISGLDMAAFYGWYISEGSCRITKGKFGKSHVVQISQNPGAKRDRIRRLLERLPWRFHETDGGLVISNRQAYRLVSKLGDVYTKRVPEWIRSSDRKTIMAFLESAIDGDGWRTEDGGETYATVSKRLADDMQELFIKCGCSASLTAVEPKPYCIRGRSGANTVRQYWVHKKIKKWAWLQGNWPKRNFHYISYSGMIYCASVPNETLIVRRGGEIAVCGNCLVGAAAAAAKLGCSVLPGGPGRRQQRRRPPAPVVNSSFRPELG